MNSYKDENRKRLIGLLDQIRPEKNPFGWEHIGSFAVGGLLSIGFSKIQSHILLVVSSSGRSLIDCNSGAKIERDYDEYEGLDKWNLSCKGVGELKDEIISISGLNGGALPQTNSAGESLEIVSPCWPEQDLIFCREHKCALIEGHQKFCNKIYSDHIQGFGFSWCGNYIVAACSSDFDLWKRVQKL